MSVERKRIISMVIIIGIVCIAMVVMKATAAEIRCENNEMIAQNKMLQSEVDTLNIKIKTASSVDQIEKIAKNKLGMVYPTSENCVFLTNEDKPKENFAAVIRNNIYN